MSPGISSQVWMHLILPGGENLGVVQLAPDFLILREPMQGALSPTNAVMAVKVDQWIRMSVVSIPEGIKPQVVRTPIAKPQPGGFIAWAKQGGLVLWSAYEIHANGVDNRYEVVIDTDDQPDTQQVATAGLLPLGSVDHPRANLIDLLHRLYPGATVSRVSNSNLVNAAASEGVRFTLPA